MPLKQGVKNLKLNKLALVACTALAPALLPTSAQACGTVSITEMSWASAQVVTAVAKFIMENGYGCEVATVPSDTVPSVASLAENNEPDIVTELWTNSTGEVFDRLLAEGKVVRSGKVIDPGGVEGWWVPAYLADAHPELATLEGVLANPELVGGMFHNCPTGWFCRVINDSLIPHTGFEAAGIEVFDHGSGETLATSIASAYSSKAPWFGYYWAPTAVLGKYKMTRVRIADYDADIHSANMNADSPNSALSDFPEAPVYTVVTTDFASREPAIAELMSKMSFDVQVMNELVSWKDENGATTDQTAAYFVTNYGSVWGDWLSDEAKAKLSSLL